MSRWRSPGRRDADGAAEQVAPAPPPTPAPPARPSDRSSAPEREADATWAPPAVPARPSGVSSTSHAQHGRPSTDQPAVRELGDELLRQAEAQRHDLPPIVDFDQDEIEAVLRRASQLGAHTHANPAELDSATLAEIAAQVGIPASAVAAAVAERRVGIDTDASWLDRLIGPDQIWAGRQSAESSEQSTERVAEWLERGHGLRPRMTDDGVVIATRRSGLAGSVVRTVRSAQGKGGLGKVREVRATSVSISGDARGDGMRDASDSDYAVGSNVGHGGAVALVADISDRRVSAMAGGGAVTAVGTLTVGTLALVTTPVVLAALPVVAGAGVLTSRLVFRPTVRRVRNELDYTADQIARGKEAPSLLGDLATPITDRLRRR
ncbi:MAG: hypothetical protein R2733_15225 [Acidimicrobiales bacterium]